MKKILLFSLLTGLAINANAQAAAFNEDFNTSCASASSIAFPFMVHNPTLSTGSVVPDGTWMCANTEGRDGTPGISCTGDFDGAYHNDTSLLLTPWLNVSSYTGSIFLNFDSRTTFISGERLSLLAITDTTADSAAELVLSPIIGPNDSAGWVTHQVDLSPYKGIGGFYIAFRYVSPASYGTKWFLDNIYTTTFPLGVNNVQTEKLPLTVIGSATETEIKVSFSTAAAGSYNLELYDIMGRTMNKQTLTTQTGTNTYTLSDLNLQPGMYFIKLGNGSAYGTTIAIVP